MATLPPCSRAISSAQAITTAPYSRAPSGPAGGSGERPCPGSSSSTTRGASGSSAGTRGATELADPPSPCSSKTAGPRPWPVNAYRWTRWPASDVVQLSAPWASMAACASRISRSSERSGTPRSASCPPCARTRRAARLSRLRCEASDSQRRPPSSCATASASLFSLMRGTAGFGMRLGAFRQRQAMAGADDVRTIPRIVEVWRIGRLVAAHAGVGGHLALDEAAGGVLHVLAGRPVAVLALDIAAADAPPAQARTADLRPVDAADPSRLLPAGDVAADAVQAELLLHPDQRVVGVRVLRLCPELRRIFMTLRAGAGADERALPARRRRAGLGLALRFREVQL